MTVHFDLGELTSLGADLAAAGPKAYDAIDGVVRKAALNIKNDMREEASGSGHLVHVPASITYETRLTVSGIEAQIGPEMRKRPQGPLAWIGYNGTSTSGPIFPDPAGALHREAERTIEWIGRAVEDVL